MKRIALLIYFSIISISVFAQNKTKIVVKDAENGSPIVGATIFSRINRQNAVQSDKNGLAVFNTKIPADTLEVTYVGYQNQLLLIKQSDTSTHTVLLKVDHTTLNEVTIVSSTRSNERIENATTKVEVLGLEEMNEESTVKPANVASILGDISGVQIQQSSATSGNVNIRVLGLDGKYTQMLRDGMPLFDGFSGGFGVLSIPPLDLKQLELIKGSSSTLYGGGAIGGLVNFISKKPGFKPDASFVLNGSTLKEFNLNGYYGQRWKNVGLTLFAGQTLQHEVDADKDGLSDLPNLKSTLIHPVLFFYPSEQSSISLGWSGNFEKRIGGDMIAIKHKGDSDHPYFEENKLSRNTFTLMADDRLNPNLTANIKATLSNFNRDIYTNTYNFSGSQLDYYAEGSLSATLNKHFLIVGINAVGNSFKPSANTPVPVGNFNNNTIGIFAQDNWRILENTKLETGLRLDHNDYGTYLLPRIALFHQLNELWGFRAGLGTGYKTPNPLTPQNKDFDIINIDALNANAGTEKSLGANIEGNFKLEWDNAHSLFINQAFFITSIKHPFIGYEQANGNLSFFNAAKPIVTKGFDTYIQFKLEDWEVYLGYTFTDEKRTYLSSNQFMPYTPKNRAASTLVYEVENEWRFGIEASYNGIQYRDDYTKTHDYVFMAGMIEKKFGPKFSLVLNGENLLDKRQSKYEPVYTGSIKNPDYKVLWAPIDGRVINLALKFTPFAK
ncbi:TonB-dependent receptor [Pedobacter montanisoli]|uniref:TonB-dependent receptor n=1 Tax=Pedobacter montanisoli TaxID=2923277 RepID=A0ABS9ZY23_9SPHI|nr:TonB-dependent receptor [Pedobacter montanisoli]MCJ0743222.1 TonB-dependent receptor [Pedobacter montanisoli]